MLPHSNYCCKWVCIPRAKTIGCVETVFMNTLNTVPFFEQQQQKGLTQTRTATYKKQACVLTLSPLLSTRTQRVMRLPKTTRSLMEHNAERMARGMNENRLNHEDKWQDIDRPQLYPSQGNYSHQLHSKGQGYRKTPASHFHREARFGALKIKGHTDLNDIDTNLWYDPECPLMLLQVHLSYIIKKQLLTMHLVRFLQSQKCRTSTFNLKGPYEWRSSFTYFTNQTGSPALPVFEETEWEARWGGGWSTFSEWKSDQCRLHSQ